MYLIAHRSVNNKCDAPLLGHFLPLQSGYEMETSKVRLLSQNSGLLWTRNLAETGSALASSNELLSGQPPLLLFGTGGESCQKISRVL